MPRVKPESLSSKQKMEALNALWTMVALLETRDEVKNFFKDLLSETEALMLARRIQIAKFLLSGVGYEEIVQKLGASFSTIGQVHRWLQGGFGGYKELVPRLEQELKRRQKVFQKKQEAATPFTLEWLKKKYPLHFLLLNLVDWATLRPPKKLRQ